ncbi:MAG: penicillin acylase family protein [candidate division Zixibacteria bacterium]|nr:penicillin acylase family protein [candidate division Zixibacteria bacterium]MDH3937680.1 penicillin acylase family protein [candidate division Zixibacteria bacterium]MDH4032327.1 penicillin acylase family protein [candidate division Zixibacteria bacterium]
MKPAGRRALKGVLLAVVGLLVGFCIAGYVLLQRTLPPTSGSVGLDKLQDNVSITFDSLGIPQIWAQSETDAIFALGYQHAADRMFQMDLIRRLSQGRLSQMLGSVTLEADKRQRMIGHARIAQKALMQLSDDNRNLLQAYSDGVNSYYVTCGSVPFEYKLLPVDFEPWTVYDCLAVLSFQTWFSDALQNRDRFHLDLMELLSRDQARQLVGSYPDWAQSTVPHESEHGSLRHPVDRRLKGRDLKIPTDYGAETDASIESSSTAFQLAVAGSLFDNDVPALSMSAASNSWVVSPDKSASNHALLAADPHLEIGRLPQFWYAVGLHVEQSSSGVLGVTVPGLPFVVMGHNGAAAWAFTAGGVDITDYYEEQLSDDDSLSVMTNSGVEPLEVVVDTIYATDALPLEVTTKLTRHGPIMIEKGGKLFSLKWAGYDVDIDAAISSGFALHQVQSFEQFRTVVTKLGALNANYMYADSSGDIGYQLATPVPIRRDGDGTFPSQGWMSTGEEEKGYLPLDKTPHALNPSQGWLVSCNNLASRLHDVPGNYAADRILRAVGLLNAGSVVTVDEMWTWQLDQQDEYLLRWRDVLADALEAIDESAAASEVRNWDGRSTDESSVMPLMVLFLSHLKRLTYQDELDGMHLQISKLTLDRMYHSDDLSWFDNVDTDEAIETRNEIAQQAARKATEIVYGVEADRDLLPPRQWGEMHSLSMRHPMAVVPVINSLLDLQHGPWPWSGSPGSLNSSFYSKVNDTTFNCVVGPSWRFVVDFADIDAVTMVLPAGNSGNPMSEHFFDFNRMWREGQRWTVPFSRDKVHARAVSTLTLRPGDTEQ